MGVVYLAFGPGQTAVAVKALAIAADGDARARIRREAELLASIKSPSIAGFVDADVEAALPWLAMNYISGPSLAEVSTPLPDPQLRQLASGLSNALATLHESDIVHRDVKPSNVILTHAGPVLVDLGIARTSAMTVVTRAGTVIGSPLWMAPEQLTGKPISAATDVWAWGIVLAFAATGRAPFGDGPIEALAWRILHSEADLQGVPDWLHRTVTAALSKESTQRPQARQLHGSARHAGTVPQSTVPSAARDLTYSATAIERGKFTRRPSRKVTALAISAGGLVIALVAVLTVVLASQDTGSPGSAHAPTITTSQLAGSTPSPTSSAMAQSSTTTQDAGVAEDSEQVLAFPAGTTPPPFPAKVSGYTLENAWRDTPRAFQGAEWTTLYEFPATMNGCSQQRFYIRWRSVNPNATIEASLISSFDEILLHGPAPGAAGWMSSYGCAQPAFRFITSTDDSSLSDIVVEVQQWEISV
jgi:serine/threonine protein kinase